ncbi:dTMP kinase [Geomobilimonas luticola]|uniref:Thymidylate kinase n=1 Tax=Geomobilimonas luticola TaxID=1114878 RepID=A0ABS5SE52_9BACT|nr:thymidylate kinase [Geomobilimonas luticola]MBT0653647.1 thymidylate kinase [Geomobilimonas luticola]
MRFYGEGIPGVRAEELVGKLVVIEGADGSGRSTQIDLLRDYLEGKGHATVNMGLRRSTLVSEELQEAKQGNVLSEITRSLFYATDFADQLENRIMPALRAGFIVLADRYIYTLMARDVVRGADREWVQSLYGIAPVPDLVIYLRVSPAQLVERNFRKNPTLDYWEAGMDLGLSRDIFDSFIRYQRLIQKEFALMQEEYSFHVVSGNLSIRSVGREITSLVEQKLEV